MDDAEAKDIAEQYARENLETTMNGVVRGERHATFRERHPNISLGPFENTFGENDVLFRGDGKGDDTFNDRMSMSTEGVIPSSTSPSTATEENGDAVLDAVFERPPSLSPPVQRKRSEMKTRKRGRGATTGVQRMRMKKAKFAYNEEEGVHIKEEDEDAFVPGSGLAFAIDEAEPEMEMEESLANDLALLSDKMPVEEVEEKEEEKEEEREEEGAVTVEVVEEEVVEPVPYFSRALTRAGLFLMGGAAALLSASMLTA